jgi:hypothetical protein
MGPAPGALGLLPYADLNNSITAMQIRFYKHVFLTPFVRLNFYTGGVSVSFGGESAGSPWGGAGLRNLRTREYPDFT